MSLTVWLSADTLGYPQGGGHRWVYMNWALGLRALGCRVIWVDRGSARAPAPRVQERVAALRESLKHYGLGDDIALCAGPGEVIPSASREGCVDLAEAVGADLLLNFRYDLPAELVKQFRRSALVDIDPGLLQLWLSEGSVHVASHDLYFTIGETVGQPNARFPDAGRQWHYTPPCVALDWWPVSRATDDAPFTTVSNWHSGEWITAGGETYLNDKRSGYLPFLDLPRHTAQSLELALPLKADDPLDLEEAATLKRHGWRLRPAQEVSATPEDYQDYIRNSRGEFSCVKPSCVRLQNAWVSDRTICYLASGKPVVVQNTGPSRFLPNGEGFFRFRDFQEAVQSLETVAADYEHQCRLARALAEEYFDARKVAGRLLERALA